jgi:dihydropteroate synthase
VCLSLSQVAEELSGVMEKAVRGGVAPWRIVADPGIGFAKTTEQNFELIRDLSHLRGLLRGLAGRLCPLLPLPIDRAPCDCSSRQKKPLLKTIY